MTFHTILRQALLLKSHTLGTEHWNIEPKRLIIAQIRTVPLTWLAIEWSLGDRVRLQINAVMDSFEKQRLKMYIM